MQLTEDKVGFQSCNTLLIITSTMNRVCSLVQVPLVVSSCIIGYNLSYTYNGFLVLFLVTLYLDCINYLAA